MKLQSPIFLLILLLVPTGRLPAQQTETNNKQFEETKTKADKGDPVAQFNLGNSYAFGQGVTKDYVEAVKWYRKAAEQHYSPAESSLGDYYTLGRGVEKNAQEGLKWYRKAAEQDYAPAESVLGALYHDGADVPRDDLEAVKWMRKAAEQGEVSAQFNLAAMNYNGDGVPKDYLQAYKWYNLAAAQGDQEAKQWLRTLERRMTPDQVGEAQRFSREFKPRKAEIQQPR